VSQVVVADSSPLIALTQIDRLGLPHNLFGSVTVPSRVAMEIRRTLPALPPWIGVRDPSPAAGAGVARGRPDTGEWEALRLTIEIEADLVLLDDLDAREWALRHGIKISGTAGVVLRAKRAGLLREVGPVLAELEWRQRVCA